jgi:hypothetical protein
MILELIKCHSVGDAGIFGNYGKVSIEMYSFFENVQIFYMFLNVKLRVRS